jgi:hypothetical protein
MWSSLLRTSSFCHHLTYTVPDTIIHRTRGLKPLPGMDVGVSSSNIVFFKKDRCLQPRSESLTQNLVHIGENNLGLVVVMMRRFTCRRIWL